MKIDMEQKHFKQDAKSIVDLLFDTKCFHESITRDHMNSIEDMLEFMLQSRFDAYIRGQKFLESVKKLEDKKRNNP